MWCKPDLMLVPGWDNAAIVRAPPPPLSRPDSQEQICPSLKRVFQERLPPDSINPRGKIEQIYVTARHTGPGEVQQKQIRAAFFLLQTSTAEMLL